MTRLNDEQVYTLEAVVDLFEDTRDKIQQMEDEFEYTLYRAKKPLRDAVDDARKRGVPASHISEGMGFKYPAQMERYLAPSVRLTDLLAGGDPVLQNTETLNNTVDNITSAQRDPNTGEITVHYNGKEYRVKANGPDEMVWAARDVKIPVAVYDIITEKFPGFVVLEDED